jgi:hypothetical protein
LAWRNRPRAVPAFLERGVAPGVYAGQAPAFAVRSPGAPGKIEMMPRLLTADDIKPLVASLTDSERIRLLRWIASPHGADASSYSAAPPTSAEFSGDDDPIAREADGWEEFR